MNMQTLVERMIGEPVRRSGGWWFWRCRAPGHVDEDASFGVREDHAHCFGCQWHGGAKWFLRNILNMRWEAVDRVLGSDYLPAAVPRRKSGIALDVPAPPTSQWRQIFSDLHLRSEGVLSRLHDLHPVWYEVKKRGVSRQALEYFRIGWSSDWVWVEEFEDWLASGLVFPGFVDGRLWSLNVRTEKGQPKYLRVKTGSDSLFGIDQCVGRETLFICEGEFDALTAWSAVGDVADVIARRGAGAPLEWWYKDRLWRYRHIIKVMDGDKAGRDSSDKLARRWPTWGDRCPPAHADDLGKMAEAGYDIRGFLLENRAICL